MDCENAYIPDGERMIFCKKSGNPSKTDRAARMHATCGFQRFCQEVHGCVLLPGWEGCLRLRENAAEKPQEAAEEKKEERTSAKKQKKNRAAEGA